MKKIYFIGVLIAFTIFLSAPVVAQKEKNSKSTGSSGGTYVNSNAKISKTYTKEELQSLGKLELTKIYMERIVVITELSPYIALHTKPGATLDEMGIPATEQNLAHLEKEVKNKEAYLKSVKDTLDDIIPYADKENIIWAIMFFDEIIKRVETGK